MLWKGYFLAKREGWIGEETGRPFYGGCGKSQGELSPGLGQERRVKGQIKRQMADVPDIY